MLCQYLKKNIDIKIRTEMFAARLLLNVIICKRESILTINFLHICSIYTLIKGQHTLFSSLFNFDTYRFKYFAKVHKVNTNNYPSDERND